MNKIIFAIVLFTALMPVAFVDAKVIILVEKAPLFKVSTVGINQILGTDVARLDFETVNVVSNANIDHWKLRIWCNEGIVVGLGQKNIDHCGKLITIAPGQSLSKFSMFLTNPDDIKAEFSFKLKAYDKDGNWLHSERKAFAW